jgi:hypothetical protein
VSVLVNKSTRVIRQGFTGSRGTFHSEHAGACLVLMADTLTRRAARLAGVLALFAAPLPALAQDAGPAEFFRQGIEACLTGGGALGPTSAILAQAGWAPDFASEEGTFGFKPVLPGAGDETYVFLSDMGDFCHAESLVTGTEAARAALESLLANGASGLTVSETGTSPAGCPTLTLSSGAIVEIASAGNDPVCQSDANSALLFVYPTGG